MRIPRIAGPYVPVYRPGGDCFPGPDTPHFKAGAWYEHWVPNDHMVLKGPDGRWHALGITHPDPESEAEIHEGEWLSFHAAAPPGALRDQLRDGAWKDEPKVLPPADRPGEIRENHAPFIVEREGLYHMLYGPDPIRLATSPDLYAWTPCGPLFSQEGGSRDPNVLRVGGEYAVVYVTQASLLARTSPDLRHWSEPKEIFRMRRPGAPESPVLLAVDGGFTLFWCIYDGTHGPYDHRTFVYYSDDPFDFHEAEEIARLDAHAPEVFQDEEGDWHLSSAEWPHRGISIAPLAWE